MKHIVFGILKNQYVVLLNVLILLILYLHNIVKIRIKHAHMMDKNVYHLLNVLIIQLLKLVIQRDQMEYVLGFLLFLSQQHKVKEIFVF
jgi:hypothetical protein